MNWKIVHKSSKLTSVSTKQFGTIDFGGVKLIQETASKTSVAESPS